MQPAKLQPSPLPLSSNGQEPSDQSIEKPEKAESSFFGAVVTRILHAIGFLETGTGTDTALADRKISSSDQGGPAGKGTQSETGITTDPQPAILMDPEEALSALKEAVEAKDAARVQSLLASLKLSSPEQAAQKAGDILKTVLQDNLPSIRSLHPEEYNKLKALIDCLLADCDHDDSTLANSALELFFDRKDFDHACHIKDTCKATANLEADRLRIALDELVQEYAPYTEPAKTIEILLPQCNSDAERSIALDELIEKYASDAESSKVLDKLIEKYGPDAEPGEHSLYDHGKAILKLANLQDAQSLEFAKNTLANGLEKCLQDAKWLLKLDEEKYEDIVNFFEEFFNHGIKDTKLAYSLMNLCFTRLNFDRAIDISKKFRVHLTDKDLVKALMKESRQCSYDVDKLLKLAAPEAAGKQIIKDTIKDILTKKHREIRFMEPYEISNFKDFIASYAWHLPGEVSDKLFLLNPLIAFCVRGNEIDMAKRLKMRFEGCYLEQQAYKEAEQNVTLSSLDETKKSKILDDLRDLTEHTKSKTD